MTDTSAGEGRGAGVTGNLEMDSLRQPPLASPGLGVCVYAARGGCRHKGEREPPGRVVGAQSPGRVERHHVGVPPAFGRGTGSEGSRGPSSGGAGCGRAGEKGEWVWVPAGGIWAGSQGLRARTPAPYRREEARSWGPNVGRGHTPGLSATPAATAETRARAGRAAGAGGAARQRPAFLPPPRSLAHQPGPTRFPSVRLACGCRSQSNLAPPLQEETNDWANFLLPKGMRGGGWTKRKNPTQTDG